MVASSPEEYYPGPLRGKTYTISVGPCSTNVDEMKCIGLQTTPVRAYTEGDILRVRNWVERFGVEHVHNVDVLFELEKLNRKALRVFTSARRAGAGEVEALVKAIWSIK